MRRAILAVLAGGVLLTGAACDSDADTGDSAAPVAAGTATTAPATSEPAPDYSADTEKVCGRLDKIFSGALADEFGAAMGKMIAQKEAKQPKKAAKAEKTAAAELKAVGTQIRKETSVAQDPELKEAGETSAAKLEQSANNRDYIEKVKSTKDLDRTLKDQIQEWLSPVAGYCA
jgi:hypothetical protein